MFVQRHEILHSRIMNTTQGLQQLPRSNPTFPMIEIEATEETFQSQVESITEAARSLVFDLESGELVRGWLLRSPQRWRFFLASHHLAWDRTSVPTIFNEITSIYKSLTKGEPIESSLLPVTYQFIDYTLWQEDWMAKPELIQPHVEYWKAQLDGIPESVSLFPMALVNKRPAMKQYNVRSVLLDLDSSLATAIKAFCKTAAVTPFMFMTSALTALIHRFTGDIDIVIGIADGDRGHTGFDRLVGFTVNMLAIRSKISKDMLYTTLLEDYRNACLEAYEHRAVPFDYLLQQIETPDVPATVLFSKSLLITRCKEPSQNAILAILNLQDTITTMRSLSPTGCSMSRKHCLVTCTACLALTRRCTMIQQSRVWQIRLRS